MRGANALVILLLSFVLGFLSSFAALGGAGYYIYNNVSINALESYGVGINTDDVISDDADIALRDMTLAGMVSELQTLYSFGDTVTIQYMIDRYGLTLDEGADKILTDELRAIPLFKLLSPDGLNLICNAVYFGDLRGYERVTKASLDLEYTHKYDYVWYNKETGDIAKGLNAVLFDFTIAEILVGRLTVDNVLKDLTIGDVLQMTSEDSLPVCVMDEDARVEVDIAPITVWYLKDGSQTDNMMGSLANFSVMEIQTKINTLTVADLVGYVEYNGEYHSWSVCHSATNGDYILLTKQSGLATDIADMSISDIASGNFSDRLSDISVASFLGYTYDEGTEAWLDGDGKRVSGIKAILADYKINELDEKINDITLGEISGFVKVEDTWYKSYDETEPSNSVLATGIVGALADMTIGSLSNEKQLAEKMKSVKVADVLGYEKVDDVYYDDEGEVTGILAVIADSEISNIQSTIDSAVMGDILGYKKVTDGEGNTSWEISEGVAPHVLMQTIADCKFSELDTLPDRLTLGDVIAEDKRTGYLAFIAPDTKLDDIPGAANDIFTTVPMYQLIDEGVVVVEDAEKKERLFGEEGSMRNYTLQDIITFAIDAADYMNSIPSVSE